MKNSPIDMLYYDFSDRIGLEKLGKNYSHLLNEVVRYGDILRKVLPERKRKILMKLMNCSAELEAEHVHFCFREGFLMGIRLMQEVFKSIDEK